MELRGAVTVVTGASAGIGRQTALDLAAAGATVVAVARRAERLADLEAELRTRGTPGTVAVCDVADRAAVEAVAERVVDEHGRIDVVVNNAGTPLHRAFADCTVDDLDRVMRVNYMGVVHWMKAALPVMTARRRGFFVNVASVAGAVPWVWEAGYSASKAAVIALSEGVAPELRRKGVGVCWVNPGMVRTEIFSEDALRHLPPASRRAFVDPPVLSAAIVDAIRRERAGVTVPRTLAFPSLVRHLTPGLFRMGLRRTYEGTLRRDRAAGVEVP